MIEAWKAAHPSVSGHQSRYAMREIVNAILYRTRSGCPWRYLPRHLPRPVVLGHSWGAQLALISTLRNPDRVGGLVCVSGTRIDLVVKVS